MGESSKVSRIRGLLVVMGAGFGAGILIALFILYNFNPKGAYLAKNVLLDSDSAYSLRFTEPGLKSKSEKRYVFDRMIFSYYDTEKKQPTSIKVPKEKYAEFIVLIANDHSLEDSRLGIQSLFTRSHSAILALKVRSMGEESSKGTELTFSEIDFVNEGDYYRVQLRQSGEGLGWAYFYHPQIYQKILNLLSPKL